VNYLGLDVGGTKCAAVIGDDAGRILARSEWPALAARGPDPMIADLLDHARPLLAATGAAAVGVAIGGPLDAARGIVLGPPNLPGWDRVPLGERLTRALGLPVAVEHDASACALAEQRWGAPDARRLIYLTCGTGFGMGFVVDGAVYRGAGGRPSDIGHIRYQPDGPIAYGKRGSLEAFAAGGALARLAAWRFPARWSADVPAGADLARLAADGDPDAQQVLRLNAQAVGHACAVLLDILYPDRISLGSLARYLGEPWLQEVRAAARAEAMPAAADACIIGPAVLGGRVQDLAAIAAAIQAPPGPRGGQA
jgi:glucokinase